MEVCWGPCSKIVMEKTLCKMTDEHCSRKKREKERERDSQLSDTLNFKTSINVSMIFACGKNCTCKLQTT